MYIFNMYHYIYKQLWYTNYTNMYSCWSVILLSNCHGFWHFGATSTVRAPDRLRWIVDLFLLVFRVWGATTETSGQLIQIAAYCGQKIFQDTCQNSYFTCDCLDDLDRLLKRPRRCVFGCATTLRVIMNYMVLVYFSRVGGPTTSHNPTLIFRR